jgi:hypothetical protein
MDNNKQVSEKYRLKNLRNPQEASDYLKSIMQESDIGLLRMGLSKIARANRITLKVKDNEEE